jgi:4-hydroxybutyrate dehydrogenase
VKFFALHTKIHQFNTFSAFASEFNLGPDDLIITQEFLYEDYMKKCALASAFLFQERYGQGEPSDEMMDHMLLDVKEDSYQRIIAIGGGTVIDIAKIFALKRAPKVSMLFERTAQIVKEKALIIVPTTCGTGSEVTNLSIAEIKEKKTKLGLGDEALLADDAVLIPEFLQKLPYQFFVYSSIDALIHAMESMVSPKSNPYTELFAKSAIKMILKGYQEIISQGPEARQALMSDFLIASNYAGIAFGTTGVGAVHAMSYPLGAKYHVAHGESNYVFCTSVFNVYYKANPNGKIKLIVELLSELLAEKDEILVFYALEVLLNALVQSKGLKEYGVTQEDIAEFSKIVIEKQQRLMVNSCIEMDYEMIESIYSKLYEPNRTGGVSL